MANYFKNMINKDSSSENRVSQGYDFLSRNEGTKRRYFAEILEISKPFSGLYWPNLFTLTEFNPLGLFGCTFIWEKCLESTFLFPVYQLISAFRKT